MSTSMESARETVQEMATRPVQVVREHPIPASLVLFGVGFGLGLLLTSKMCESMFHEETTTEQLSRQFNNAMSEIKGMLQRGYSAMR
jgi:hypothetical protein